MRNKTDAFFIGMFVGIIFLAITLCVQSYFDKESIQPGDVVYSHTHNEKFLVLKQLENDRLLTAPIDTFVLDVKERGKNVNKLEYK
jgi:hypothetical protein